ncbi:hypothetical protein BJ944DRAFT_161661 [Cunninghamella echinulata]|nr:hypothetical protein BJ944DRAFT_161661 [Cunninghamella echinulata]
MWLEPGLVGPDGLEIMSELISLVCITLLAGGFGSKTYNEDFKNLNYGRVLVILLYFSSWAFSFTSCILVSTNDNNLTSCTLGMMACNVFYCGSKIVCYAWLIERVHLVTNTKTARLKSWQYRVHLLLLSPYLFIFVLMMTFKNIYLLSDGKCIIGLQFIASIPLLIYDFVLNLYLTWLFMRPLMNVGRNSRMDWKRSRLYRLAKRTLVASVVCLLVSLVNVTIVVWSQGNERGLVCLSMCTVDVTVNVLTVHWVTSNGNSKENNGAKTTRNIQTADHITAEMTFDEGVDGFNDKQTRFEGKTLHTLHEDRQSDSGSSSSSSNGKHIHKY